MAANFPLLTESQQMACLAVLSISSRKKLSLYLKSSQRTKVNDLAKKIGFSNIDILNFAHSPDPMAECLNEWIKKHEFEPTVGKLIQYLEELDRNDVITECLPFIIQDIDDHLLNGQLPVNSSPIQDQTVSQSEHQTFDGNEILTIDDANDYIQIYDAYVVYNQEGEYENKFVKQLISIAESPPHNMKLFINGRNDLPGLSVHASNAFIIEHRCRKTVLIMSKKFLASPDCDFQTKHAFCLAPGATLQKLIPVLIEPCTIPDIIKHIKICDYTTTNFQEVFWERLIKSIKTEHCFGKTDSLVRTISTMSVSSDYTDFTDSSDYYSMSSRPSCSSSNFSS